MRRAASALLGAAALGCWAGAAASAATVAVSHARPAARSVLVVFAPVSETQLARVGGLSVGIVSAAQSRYSQTQFLLDITQGARIADTAYASAALPQLSLERAGGGAVVDGWPRVRERAEGAPQLLRPGLLASSVTGAGGYVGLADAPDLDGLLAAGQGGRIAAFSLGSASTLLTRLDVVRERERFAVVDLPDGREALRDLRMLLAERSPGELLIVLQRPAHVANSELLWGALAGLGAGAGARELTSASTRERGMIASFDLTPTILAWLGERIPADVRGKTIETDGPLHSASLRALMSRLHVIGGRRLRALGVLLTVWALLLLLAAGWPQRVTRPRARAWAMRIGGLGVLWAPVVALLPAALEPGAAVEYALVTVGCLALGALTDALLPWPRAPLAPALAAIVALTVDALAGTQLLMRSLLGPDPILGARFYGIGNELKSGLAVLVAGGVAGALYPSVRGRRAAFAMAGAGVLLAVIEGAARIGSGVGGVVLVSFAFALATVLLLPGALTRRRGLAILIIPVVGLVALAALDLATAHGSGHFTGSVLHARSAGDLRDIIVRRYRAAWNELHNHAMPVATLCALAYAAAGVRWRARMLRVVRTDPAWLAALAGGLAAGVVGSLVEDSGPELLVVAAFALGCLASYLWGRPSDEPHAGGTCQHGAGDMRRRLRVHAALAVLAVDLTLASASTRRGLGSALLGVDRESLLARADRFDRDLGGARGA